MLYSTILGVGHHPAVTFREGRHFSIAAIHLHGADLGVDLEFFEDRLECVGHNRVVEGFHALSADLEVKAAKLQLNVVARFTQIDDLLA